MGGKGSGRKAEVREQRTPIMSDMFIPNLSGAKRHQEISKEFLYIDGSNANTAINIQGQTFACGTLAVTGTAIIVGNIIIGDSTTDTITLTFDGNTRNGVITFDATNNDFDFVAASLTTTGDITTTADISGDNLTLTHDLIIDHTATTDNDQVTSTAEGGSRLTFTRTGGVPGINSRAANGTTSARTYLDDTDQLYRVSALNWIEIAGGTWSGTTCAYQMEADGDHSFGNYPTKHVWKTTTTNPTTLKKRMELDKNGMLFFVEDNSGVPYGEIKVVDNSTETTISASGTPVQITIFDTNGESNGGTTPDHTNDHITINKAGRYMINISATVNSVAGAASRFEMTCKKNNGASEIITHINRNLAGGGGESGVISMSGIADLAANDTIEVWIENETNTQNYVVEDISLAVFMLGGT